MCRSYRKVVGRHSVTPPPQHPPSYKPGDGYYRGNSRRTLSTHPQHPLISNMKPLTFARSAILFAPMSESRGSASGRM